MLLLSPPYDAFHFRETAMIRTSAGIAAPDRRHAGRKQVSLW
jgi:hypothetical protein